MQYRNMDVEIFDYTATTATQLLTQLDALLEVSAVLLVTMAFTFPLRTALTLYSALEQPGGWLLVLRELLPGLLLVVGPWLLSALCLLIAERWARHAAHRDPSPPDQGKLDRLHLSYRG